MDVPDPELTYRVVIEVIDATNGDINSPEPGDERTIDALAERYENDDYSEIEMGLYINPQYR